MLLMPRSRSDLAGFPRHRSLMLSWFWPVLVCGMVCLLGIVALLQYRWTEEARNAEEVRIGSNLESLMRKWHNDLYGEFSAICVAMQVGPDSGARDTWKDYLDRYVEWNDALPREAHPYIYRNPDLVGEIYIWETGASNPHLFWLNLESKRIESKEIPGELSDLLVRLRASSANLPAALAAWKLSGQSVGSATETDGESDPFPAGSNANPGWQFDTRVPAIVHPIFHHNQGRPLSSGDPVDWIVITIDMNVLRKRVLPGLATRYFGGLDGLDYKVALVETGGTESRTIFSSSPGFGAANLNDADSALDIFAPPTSPLLHLVRDRNGSEPAMRKNKRTINGPAWFPIVEHSSGPEDWMLILQQRGEPVQSVLNRIRRRNLGVSALVLLLLAANIGMLTVAGYRSYRFAELQLDFVASISHNLRTPLTAIFSAGENLADSVVTEGSGLRNYGALIMDNARQLRYQVDRILRFASIRSGKDRYNLCPLDMAEVLERVRKDTSSLLKGSSCSLDVYIEPFLPAVLGDQFAVCECLENLISNAAKYSREDRRIHVAAVSSRATGGAQEVAISVADHGPGIKSSELDQLFEPFYRSPDAVAAQVRGTGLGLFLAKHVANSMGGLLTVTSELGRGSVFTLHLHCANASAREREQIPNAISGVKG